MKVPDFSEIYTEYFSDVYKYMLSICRDDILAEEITQETFFKAMKEINNFNGTCKLYVWLCQIAKNTYFTFYKKQNRNLGVVDEKLPSYEFDLEERYLDRENAVKLHIILHNLNEPYKEVFTLRIFGELSFSQIGNLFGKSDSWARVVFYRAKKQIQEAIK